MIDKSIAGHTAAPDEIERMMRNLCAYALSEPDPLQRYLDLTHQQVVFDGVASMLRNERGKALADLLDSGVSLAAVAESAHLETPGQVKTLVTASGRHMPAGTKAGGKPAKPAKPAKARSTDPAPAKAWPTDPAPAKPVMEPAAAATRIEAKPTGTRLMTPEERAALGLTPHGPIAFANRLATAS